jgi:hypothetical protein
MAEQLPPTAQTFAVYRVTMVNGKNKETGARWSRPKAERLTGDPDAKGRVANVWPVGQFDPATIMARWGEGRYRVDLFDKAGTKLDHLDMQLEAPRGPAPPDGTPLAPAPAARAASAPEMPGVLKKIPGAGEAFELMAFFHTMTADARAEQRAEGDRAAERDRAFFNAQIEMMKNVFNSATTPHAGGALDADLIKRELLLAQKETALALETRITTALAGLQTELGEAGPDVINGLMGVLGQYLKKKKIALSPRMRRQVREFQQRALAAEAAAAVNGAAEEAEEDDDEDEAHADA